MSFYKKPSIVDGTPVLNEFEQDSLTVPLDTQNTTLGGALRLMIKEQYTPTLPLDRLQQGMIVKEVVDPNDFDYTQVAELETQNRKDITPIRYKVYILGKAGEIMPPPESFDDSSISCLDDYSVSPKFEGALSVGMNVFVDINKRIIEFSNQSSVNNSASDKEKQVTSRPNKAYEDPKMQKGGPVNIDKIPDDVTEGDAYVYSRENGKKVLKKQKIKLKTIVSYSSQRLRSDAADKFNELCRDAAKEQVKIIASSGFREMQDQIRLYNDRYVHPYPRRPSENTKSPNGRRIGVAAYPGTSNHQGGIAVDIDVGKHLDEKDRYSGDMGKHPAYLWMTRNAEKYGFDNREGRQVNEPWHWVYNKAPPESALAAEESKDGPDGGKS
jgi:LAS superfamily LD-carboxypeptidase LdcB